MSSEMSSFIRNFNDYLLEILLLAKIAVSSKNQSQQYNKIFDFFYHIYDTSKNINFTQEQNSFLLDNNKQIKREDQNWLNRKGTVGKALLTENRDDHKNTRIESEKEENPNPTEIIIEDIKNDWRGMKNNKAPGPGGIPSELQLKLWKLLYQENVNVTQDNLTVGEIGGHFNFAVF